MSRLSEIAISEDLIARARGGEDAAQAAIYRGIGPAVFALTRRLVGNRAVAEDLFQDTMMTLFQRLGDFRGEAPLGIWLRQIAVTKCLMYLRSPWHRARLQLDERAEDEHDHADLYRPSQAAPAPETLDVERALASLSPTARAVVWLFEVEGYSHDEIGRAFGRTASFSKSQLARAHYRLRAWFEPAVEPPACTSI